CFQFGGNNFLTLCLSFSYREILHLLLLLVDILKGKQSMCSALLIVDFGLGKVTACMRHAAQRSDILALVELIIRRITICLQITFKVLQEPGRTLLIAPLLVFEQYQIAEHIPIRPQIALMTAVTLFIFQYLDACF